MPTRKRDKPIFSSAAAQFQAWILVRRTNKASLDYVGVEGYVPKRIDCKAKTANENAMISDPTQTAPGHLVSYEHAGLVVDPTCCPGAFSGSKRDGALKEWPEFAAKYVDKNSAYTVDKDKASRHFGCVMQDGDYIHGDYDLYDIVPIADPSKNSATLGIRHGTLEGRHPLLEKVESYINRGIKVDMIQHGAWAQGFEHSNESIDAFGPHGEDVTILNQFSVEGWYRERFKGRNVVSIKGWTVVNGKVVRPK